MRRASAADLPAIRRTLEDRVHQAMFPLANLDRFGLDGDHDYAPRMWVSGDRADVLSQTRNGVVMPALPSGDFAAAARALAGRSISGFIGPAEEVRPLAEVMGLAGQPASIDRDEPQFLLDLRELVIPGGAGQLLPLQAADRDEMIAWRAAYEVEALGIGEDKAKKIARDDVAAYLAADSHRVLVSDGAPLSTTGFNAALPRIVQVGGVYTPPALRGRGHARRAVALHLDEARKAGVARATLFSASDAASRCYEAIGFRRVGLWTLHLFSENAVHDG